MLCEYCRQLFELRLKSVPYMPHRPAPKPLSGFSGTDQAPWIQLQLNQQLLDQHMLFPEETILNPRRGSRRTQAASKIIYEDPKDLFTDNVHWWKVPIGGQALTSSNSHLPGSACQVCDMIFSSLSPLDSHIFNSLQQKANKDSDLGFVYQLKSTKSRVAEKVARLSIWLKVGNVIRPLVKLQVMKQLRKCRR